MKNDWLDNFDPLDLIINSLRYYMGRRTIGNCCFAENLAKAWPKIPRAAQEIIKRELKAEFARDDEARARGDHYLPLGHDIDRQHWEKVREAWVKCS